MAYKDKEKRKKCHEKWKSEHPNYWKERRKNKKNIREKESYRAKTLEAKGRQAEGLKQRWPESSKKGSENKMSLNKSLEFLESLKDKESIDIKVIDQMKDRIKSLDEALLRDLEELVGKLHKPIRKVWYFAVKAKEGDVKKIEEGHNDWIEQVRTEFPEAMITMSGCQDRIIKNNLGRE